VKSTGARKKNAPAAAPDGEDFVTAMLRASRALVGLSVRSLAKAEETVTLTQFRTLVVFDNHGEINLNRLAEALDVNPSTAMRMVDRLVAAGLVTRRENPANRREVLLGLTRDGTRLVCVVTKRRRAAISKIVASMPPDRREDFLAALHAFAFAAGEPHPADGAASLGW